MPSPEEVELLQKMNNAEKIYVNVEGKLTDEKKAKLRELMDKHKDKLVLVCGSSAMQDVLSNRELMQAAFKTPATGATIIHSPKLSSGGALAVAAVAELGSFVNMISPAYGQNKTTIELDLLAKAIQERYPFKLPKLPPIEISHSSADNGHRRHDFEVSLNLRHVSIHLVERMQALIKRYNGFKYISVDIPMAFNGGLSLKGDIWSNVVVHKSKPELVGTSFVSYTPKFVYEDAKRCQMRDDRASRSICSESVERNFPGIVLDRKGNMWYGNDLCTSFSDELDGKEEGNPTINRVKRLMPDLCKYVTVQDLLKAICTICGFSQIRMWVVLGIDANDFMMAYDRNIVSKRVLTALKNKLNYNPPMLLVDSVVPK